MNRTVHRFIEPPSGGGRAKKINLNRAQVVDQNFVEFVQSRLGEAARKPPSPISMCVHSER